MDSFLGFLAPNFYSARQTLHLKLRVPPSLASQVIQDSLLNSPAEWGPTIDKNTESWLSCDVSRCFGLFCTSCFVSIREDWSSASASQTTFEHLCSRKVKEFLFAGWLGGVNYTKKEFVEHSAELANSSHEVIIIVTTTTTTTTTIVTATITITITIAITITLAASRTLSFRDQAWASRRYGSLLAYHKSICWIFPLAFLAEGV